VRNLLVAITGLLGAAAFWRRRSRRKAAAELGPADSTPDPAEELRAKLAESRASVPEPELPDEPIGAEPEASPLDPQTRRRNVHEQARSAIDELQ